jgi:hypothetical protein
LARRGGAAATRPPPTRCTLSPEEEQAKLEAAIREQATEPFKLLRQLGDAWHIFTDAEVEAAREIARAFVAKADAWLKTAKGKRPVLDCVKYLAGNGGSDAQ